jgi:hypothetical protein
MNFGGSDEPWATAMKLPMPSFSQALRSSTSALMRGALASFFASAAR